ncbi:DUF998 domain-containing protein [Methanobacterium alkalithermotolerans]|uniref:DUF998 domain-containing protein n=1 Tax=Methanobacterium alkalithermotolerans TaxID=2731220 RepID=A0A8T8K6W2_9EURY|nr:DUF998 domain-containing protein [Methanobacterium alkalithermotolerans]QUH22843.1 DUF998 domain-containing protein [Methanobacterium alkalithermotolerans]
MSIKEARFLLPVFIILLMLMFILPFYSFPGYSLLNHTTSHLGAQNAPNAWIMNLTFIILGLACAGESFLHLKRYPLNQILLIIFGVGLFMVGIFHHAPVIGNDNYSIMEDNLHSIFASLVGISFTLFAFSAVFIENNNLRRIIALVVAIMAIILSILMFRVVDYMGIWQRIMFIAAFSWLIFFLEGIRSSNKKLIKSSEV